ncbi:hypothetical protein [Faecalibaculum rodentium]|jgi:hypothetical protein|uniref:hypothetical protein n=1 Tax=Faecalibaculum rodentium TaxID=1702221 RepID=UPI003EBFFBA5
MKQKTWTVILLWMTHSAVLWLTVISARLFDTAFIHQPVYAMFHPDLLSAEDSALD